MSRPSTKAIVASTWHQSVCSSRNHHIMSLNRSMKISPSFRIHGENTCASMSRNGMAMASAPPGGDTYISRRALNNIKHLMCAAKSARKSMVGIFRRGGGMAAYYVNATRQRGIWRHSIKCVIEARRYCADGRPRRQHYMKSGAACASAIEKAWRTHASSTCGPRIAR